LSDRHHCRAGDIRFHHQERPTDIFQRPASSLDNVFSYGPQLTQ
jgi:hypothetical protein